MNHTYYSLLLVLLLGIACSPPPAEQATSNPKADPVSYPEKIASGTIYEVNIRQHTPEGTINAFRKDLPRLKDMGIQMLWLMPVQPIGEKNRKGPLGSYYSISNYKTVNPEFGSMEDFKQLVTEAHAMDIAVILDWVPNHTAWDNPWITEHPEYYAKDEQGNITYEADWTDIALLDHTHPGTRAAMIDAMAFWVTETDIDGFRCDHAGHEIPLYFWEEATAAIDPLKDIFWLAEWDGARMHLEFDGTYAWELLHLTEAVAKGEKTANDLDTWVKADIQEYGMKPFRMTMITNHDENSWNGTIEERYGEGGKTFATFIFTAYGIPMLYSGQEVGLNKRLKFFEKDNIDWSDPNGLQDFYTKLVSLKADNPAIWAGEFGGMPERINADEHVYAFQRSKNNNTVIGIMNFSGENQSLNLTQTDAAGSYTDYFTGESYSLAANQALDLAPWQYLVFRK